MSIKVKAKAFKSMYHSTGFDIIAFSPVHPYSESLKLSKYITFSCKGDLSWCSVGKEYELEIEEAETNKYGTTYTIVSVPSLMINLKDLTVAQSKELLMDFTTERQAENILSAYPDFIYKIVTEGKESIDIKKIHNVGEVYLNAYTREINTRYKYFGIIEKIKEWNIDVTDCKKLVDEFLDEINIVEAFKESPYRCLIDILDRSFEKADNLIMELRPDLKYSEQRCAYLILNVLKKNEEEGSTRLNANIVYNYIINEYPQGRELEELIVPTVKTNKMFYYNDETKDLAIMTTYLAECRIADFIKDKIKNSHKLDIDCEKYRVDGDVKLTDAQMGLLHNFCNYDFMLLAGYAGCVDKDTEFFNGKKWKKISEYKNGDKVLQWNKDGNATLVEPLDYIKLPCDKMYHFETKYGIDQTLSGEHRIITYSPKGFFHERKMEEVLQIHNERGFHEKFQTSFNYNGSGIDLTDDEIKLMCAVICDGSFYSYSKEGDESYYTCRFHIKKDRKKEALRKLFKDGSFTYKEKESVRDGYIDFYVKAPRREKVFTEYWYNCNNHQLQIICDNILQWDGNANITNKGKERKRFFTTIKETADFIQFAFSSCGYRATIQENNRKGRMKKINEKEYETKSIDYNVNISNNTFVGLCSDTRPDHTKTEIKEVIPEDGYKYCFTVPSSYLVLRRNNKIFITGNSGKTMSIHNLITLMEDNNLSYTLLSSTGKASRVLSENTHRTASTIHKRCYQGKITSDVVIIDEFGMVNLDTFIMLLNSIDNDKIKIILVGDNAQLSAIGLSKIFEDLIKSEKVPVTMLTEVFRYKSNGSLFVATNVRQGKSFFEDKENVKNNNGIYSVGNNYKFIEKQDDEVFDEVIKQYMSLLNKGINKKDILVLSPFNKGDMGTYAINNAIQAEINPPKVNEQYHTRKINNNTIIFRTGDLVINTKNDYHAVSEKAYREMIEYGLHEEDVEDSVVVNGQIGIIREVVENGLIIQYDEELIYVSKSKLNNLLLGYAISSHKSQGSGSNYVISIVSNQHKKMLSRGLLYVMDTRCKKACIDIGQVEAFETGLKVVDNDLKNTFLLELMLTE